MSERLNAWVERHSNAPDVTFGLALAGIIATFGATLVGLLDAANVATFAALFGGLLTGSGLLNAKKATDSQPPPTSKLPESIPVEPVGDGASGHTE